MRRSDFNDYSGLNLVGAIRKLHSKDVAIEGFKGTIESKERCIKELEQSIDVHDQAESYLSDLIEQKGRDIAELVAMLNKVEDLMTDSVGVEGLHMNGDLATWDSLLRGGFYEDWLGGFNELLDKHTRAE